MKIITKTLLKLVSASVVTAAVLTAAAAVSAEGYKSARTGLQPGAAEGSWYGSFVTDDVNTYANTFNDPYYYSVFVNGRTTKITAINSYRTNYKWAAVTLTDANGKTYYSPGSSKDANKQTLSVTSSYKNVIARGFYYAYIQAGSDSNAKKMASSGIEVKLPDYQE